MKSIAIIPARYGSSRFPGKPLALINGRPMVQIVYEKVKSSKLLDRVIIATDDIRIFNTAISFGGDVIMTSKKHSSGTDRIVEVLQKLDCIFDIVLNIQGDEPMICSEMIERLIEGLNDPRIMVSTLKKEILEKELIINPDIAKVITDFNNDAIYFSRLPIPYDRDELNQIKYYKHIGMYGYRSEFFNFYKTFPLANLEEAEQLEQLRILYYGYKIKVLEVYSESIGVDRPEHLSLVEKYLRN